MTLTTQKTSHISIIIPTLNEETSIEAALGSLPQREDMEIIVADGGSSDRTVALARNLGATTVTSAPGRGVQMNRGASQASGDTLLFLHCDTRLPDDFPSIVRDTLALPDTAAGAFRLHIDASGCCFRIIEWGGNLRSRFFGLPFGDQALFLPAEMFKRAGEFPDQRLLEELVLLRKLKPLGRIRIAPSAATTSPRRWLRLGLVRTTCINQVVLTGYLLGINPDRLSRLYYPRQRDEGKRL